VDEVRHQVTQRRIEILLLKHRQAACDVGKRLHGGHFAKNAFVELLIGRVHDLKSLAQTLAFIANLLQLRAGRAQLPEAAILHHPENDGSQHERKQNVYVGIRGWGPTAGVDDQAAQINGDGNDEREQRFNQAVADRSGGDHQQERMQ
jgi:hypothetical protein